MDREHFPGGQVKPARRDVASPFALAKRAVLVDHGAAQAAIAEARSDHKAAQAAIPAHDRENFTIEDAARAAGRSLSPGSADRASTALGRYWFWSRRQGKKYRMTEAQYLGGLAYAGAHGAAWAGLRYDLTIVAEQTDGALQATGIVVQRRHPPAHLGNLMASTPGELAPRAELSPDEKRARREKQWRRYIDAHDKLVRQGFAVAMIVEDLVIEDHDPWWIAPAPSRLREGEARARANGIFSRCSMILAGLDVLADCFDTHDDKSDRASAGPAAPPQRIEAPRGSSPQAAATAAEAPTLTRSDRPRMPVIFGKMAAEIDPAAVAAAIANMKRQGARPNG